MPDAEKYQQDIYNVISKVNVFFKTWEVDPGAKIPRGRDYISKILELKDNQFHMVNSNKPISLQMEHYQYRVKIFRL